MDKELKLINISDENIEYYVRQIKKVNLSSKKIIGKTVDIDSFDKFERELLFNNGDYTPEYIAFWLKLIFQIIKSNTILGHGGSWIDNLGKKYYDETLSTTLDLMSDSLRWHNDRSNMLYIWGKKNQKNIFKESFEYSGIVMPVLEGWGIIAIYLCI